MTRVRWDVAESRLVSGWLKQRFLGLSGFAAIAAILMALTLFVGSTGPAEALLLESQAETARRRARTETAVPIQLERLPRRGRCADMIPTFCVDC